MRPGFAFKVPPALSGAGGVVVLLGTDDEREDRFDSDGVGVGVRVGEDWTEVRVIPVPVEEAVPVGVLSDTGEVVSLTEGVEGVEVDSETGVVVGEEGGMTVDVAGAVVSTVDGVIEVTTVTGVEVVASVAGGGTAGEDVPQ